MPPLPQGHPFARSIIRPVVPVVAWVLALLAAGQVRAQSVTVTMDTTKPTTVAVGFSGTNINSSDTPLGFADPKVRAFAKALSPKTLRWPGGTVDDFIDWRTGLIPPLGSTPPGPLDIEKAVFGPIHGMAFGQQVISQSTGSQPILAAKGGNPLGTMATGFGGFATALEARIEVVVNATSDTAASAQALAFAVASEGLPVSGFELVNEPFYLVVPPGDGAIIVPQGAPAVPGAFTDGSDYLAKMLPYYRAVKAGYLQAGVDPSKAVVAIAGGYEDDTSGWNATWASDLARYVSAHGAYWDAVAFHFYPPKSHGKSFAAAMQYANSALVSGTGTFMEGYRAANWSRGKPLVVTEFGPTFDDQHMNGSVYGGIFTAEYVARMSAYPEVRMVLMHELFNDGDGIGTSGMIGGQDWKTQMTAVGRSGGTVNTSSMDAGMFYNAQILGLALVDAAVNASDKAYPTSVTGSTGSVQTASGTIPALFAQAYHGRNGTVHVLVTNKDKDPKILSFVLDGTNQTGMKTTETMRATAGDPSESNSSAKSTVALQQGSAIGPLAVQGYSVTHVAFTPR